MRFGKNGGRLRPGWAGRWVACRGVWALAAVLACSHGLAFGADGSAYRPLTYSSDTWHGSTYWTGGEWIRVGRTWHHPGMDVPTVRRFVVPADGRVTITGRAFKLDTNGGDGVRLAIRLDGREVWSAQIGPKDGNGVEPRLALDVRKGQSIRFVVQPGQTHFCDTTGWDPTVAYDSGAKYRASEGFSDRQDQGPWRYELELLPGKPHPPGLAAAMPDLAGLDLPAVVEIKWRREDRIDGAAAAYARAVAAHLPRTRRLLADLRADRPAAFLAAEAAELDALAATAAASQPAAGDEKLYLQLRRLKRRIALVNPLMGFGPMLFCKRVPGRYSHHVMQHYGFFARPGGGLFVLDRPGHLLEARDILGGKFADGCILEPRLSYDGRKVLFSFVRCSGKPHDINKLDNVTNEDFYHLYMVNVDGTGLRQLTDEPYDDLMPTWLPDGGIVFCSSRRATHARCFHRACGTRWQTYTLYRADVDGGNIRPLSYHDTNEWYPAVANSGHILYARWDYIDRDAVTHQNLWSTRPDGTNPLAVWGNAVTSPHCAFQAQPVPGSDRIVFTASAHHSLTGGSIALLDPAVHNNDGQALTRLTPEVPFPEAEGTKIDEYYASPWPLSEKYFLVSYSPVPLVFEPGLNPPNAMGIYLLDAFGNRELLYRDGTITSVSPCPLTARPAPPVLPTLLPAAPPATGTVLLTDVYRGLGDVPRGHIRELRIVQIFPKTTPYQNEPPIGVAREENARAILGTVPVEPDGSACFELPAGRPVLFQALDKYGLAFQTMRTITYVQPGETVSCAGCHESRQAAPPAGRAVLALRREPSKIFLGPLGGSPLSFVRLVQPVLDKHCLRCHGGAKTEKNVDLTAGRSGDFTRSYVSLTCEARLVPRYAMRNQVQVTQPGGAIGAAGSGLLKMLRAGHHHVKLSDDDIRRLAAWIDCNAVFFGSYDTRDNAAELRGEAIAMPKLQ